MKRRRKIDPQHPGAVTGSLGMGPEIVLAHPNNKASHQIADILAHEQFPFKLIANLEELQTYLETTPCSTVIIDMDDLPVDRQLFRNLKRLLPKLNILALSSRTFHPELEEAMTRHIYACLNKPVDPEEMIYLLKSVYNAANLA